MLIKIIAASLVIFIIMLGSIGGAGADDPLPDVTALDLLAYPVLPDDLGIAADVFARGQSLGRDPHTISKVGDCNSVDWLFLHPFAEGQYDLGEYGELQTVIDWFGTSFDGRSLAATNGMNAEAVRNPLWAHPAQCEASESPLTCEYRVRNASIAMIMFGSNDVLSLSPEQFDKHLRLVVQETLDAGVVPILSTFPRYVPYPDRSILYNQIVVQIALDYRVPLVNLWRALEFLPAHGIDRDGYHLNGPWTRAGDFASADNLQTGYPMRNLVTLQSLDVVWRRVISPHIR